MTDYFKYRKKIYCEDTDETCVGYVNYLKSKHWQMLRSRLVGVNRRCAKCSKQTSNIQLHHLTYERLGHELDSDLIPLCNSCHNAEHAKNNPKKTKKQTNKNVKSKKKGKRNTRKKKKVKIKRPCKLCGFFSYDKKIHQCYCLYHCIHISSNKNGCSNYSSVGYITRYSKKTCSV